MVMSDRPEVRTASWPIAAVDIAGLASSFMGAICRLPFRDPWRGPGSQPRNLAVSATREFIRSLLGYASSLPIDEFRSLERVLDGIAGQVLPPFVALQGVASQSEVIGGVPGVWFRPHRSVGSPDAVDGQSWPGTIVYLHGGGYIGTSPRMYAVFMAHLARVTGCAVFVADYRLAPEFPFPAAVDDVLSVTNVLLRDGLAPERLIIAGDSGGGGLVGTVLHRFKEDSLCRPGAVLLFSPEVSLTLSEDSVTDNAPLDVLPWNIPVNSYLHGIDPQDERVDVLLDDVADWPPTFLTYGADEMFRDAIRQLAEKLHAANVHHDISEVEGMFHVFPFLLPWAEESRDVYRRAGEFVKGVLGQTAGWELGDPCACGPSAPEPCNGEQPEPIRPPAEHSYGTG
jgi:epsilon-lactone hydrolase